MILADNFHNAGETLGESINFINELNTISIALTPYEEMKKRDATLTKQSYRRNLVVTLMGALKKNYEIIYPNIRVHFLNGDGNGVAASKLSAAYTEFSLIKEELIKAHYMIRTDEEQSVYQERINACIRYMLLFIIEQYKINRYPTDICLSVKEFCERNNITKQSEFISIIKSMQQEFNAELNVYDKICEEYKLLNEIDSDLLLHAEQALYPLTISRARELIEDPNLLAEENLKVTDYMKKNVVTESNLSLNDVLKKMSLSS